VNIAHDLLFLGNVEVHFMPKSLPPSCRNEFHSYFFHVLLPSNAIQKMPRLFSIWCNPKSDKRELVKQTKNKKQDIGKRKKRRKMFKFQALQGPQSL
jgi:hypothetical protein